MYRRVFLLSLIFIVTLISVDANGAAGILVNESPLKSIMSVNVMDFGAVGDGAVDDTAAIQAAIDSQTSGGEVFLPAGKYKVTSTIQVGNGSALEASTRNVIKLRGVGIAPNFKDLGTELVWAGPPDGTVVSFNGSGDGFGFDGIQVNCNSIAGFGMRLYSIRNSVFTNFSIKNFRTTGLSLAIRNGPPATVLYGSGNLFSNYVITSIQPSVVSGLSITGNYSANSDWFRNVFMNGIVQIQNGVSSSANAGYIEFADHNTFMMCDFDVVGKGSAHGLMLNSANNTYYPQNNFFSGGSITNVSVYENAGSVIGNNFFSPFTTADGEIIPDNSKLRGITDRGTVFGSFNLTSNLTISKSVPSLNLSTPGGSSVWHLLNNASYTSDFGFEINNTVGKTTTPFFKIDNNGDSYIFISGVGLRKIVVDKPDSAGKGYRILKIAN